MTTINEKVTLDFHAPGGENRGRAVEGDAGSRKLTVTFACDGEKVTPDSEDEVICSAKRSDGEKAVWTLSQENSPLEVNGNGEAEFTLPCWLLSVPGTAEISFSLLNGEKKLTAETLYLFISPSVSAEAREEYDEFLPFITRAAELLGELTEDLSDMQTEIESLTAEAREALTNAATARETALSAASSAQTGADNASAAAQSAVQAAARANTAAAECEALTALLRELLEGM